MSWIQTLAVVFHVLLAFGIIGLVLLQRGRGADAGAGFGAGASGTVFGSRGSASFLSRTTAVLATLFFVTSLGLSYLFSQQVEPTSVVDRVQVETPAPQPTTPASQLPAFPGEAAPAPAAAPAVEQAAPAAPAPEAPPAQ
ncbi:MAG: preprotein translocase subunit SecG [Steroidobacteraceae bacterium]